MGFMSKWILLVFAVTVWKIAGARNPAQHSHDLYDGEHQVVRREGDMLFPAKDMEKMNVKRGKRAAAIADESLRWKDNLISIEIAHKFSKWDIYSIKFAAWEWSFYTCLSFENNPKARNRVRIVDNGHSCSSYVGMQGGVQTLTLANFCTSGIAMLHEFGHVIGLEHEHQRPDRDDYVTIQKENLEWGVWPYFNKFGWNEIVDLGIPYDYYSIMHYGGLAWTRNYKTTIKTKDPAYQQVIGWVWMPSLRDIQTVNRMYNCSSDCNISDSDCPPEGFVGKDCACWCSTDRKKFHFQSVQYCSAKDRATRGDLDLPLPPAKFLTYYPPCLDKMPDLCRISAPKHCKCSFINEKCQKSCGLC